MDVYTNSYVRERDLNFLFLTPFDVRKRKEKKKRMTLSVTQLKNENNPSNPKASTICLSCFSIRRLYYDLRYDLFDVNRREGMLVTGKAASD